LKKIIFGKNVSTGLKTAKNRKRFEKRLLVNEKARKYRAFRLARKPLAKPKTLTGNLAEPRQGPKTSLANSPNFGKAQKVFRRFFRFSARLKTQSDTFAEVRQGLEFFLTCLPKLGKTEKVFRDICRSSAKMKA